MKNFQQLAVERRRLGKSGFRARFGKPALVGVGLVAEMDDQRQFRPTGTIAMDRVLPEAVHSAVVGRAWLITKGPDGPHGPAVTLGRSAYNDIVVPEYTVSKRHCEFRYQPGRILLSDLDSFNGTYVNGERLRPKQKARLQQKDEIILGRYLFHFLTADEFVACIEQYAA